jgi:hypothetical protein
MACFGILRAWRPGYDPAVSFSSRERLVKVSERGSSRLLATVMTRR